MVAGRKLVPYLEREPTTGSSMIYSLLPSISRLHKVKELTITRAPLQVTSAGREGSSEIQIRSGEDDRRKRSLASVQRDDQDGKPTTGKERGRCRGGNASTRQVEWPGMPNNKVKFDRSKSLTSSLTDW